MNGGDFLSSRIFKDRVYSEFARIGKVLSSPKRLELLDLLSQSPKSVETLSNETRMSMANTSKHLQALLEARLVDFRKDKNFVIYRLANPQVVDLLFSIKALAEEQIAEVPMLREQYIVKSDRLETMGFHEWLTHKDKGNLILIDVRPREEYAYDHLEGAISIPIDELDDQLNHLPKNQQIVVYCRGSYCMYATEVVERLQSEGFKAIRLEAGIHEWHQLKKVYG